MTKTDNGGAAYPAMFEGGNNNGETPYFEKGMTLRDYFAGQAMQAVISTGADNTVEHIATVSYMAADAMIAARKATQ